ncbi:unnamed protein product [Callosobruchus maculatus]|uniref:Uncharacterized protein n=1 Tax=Callosobruchus maculatus TaxID=64391 RepID=A0A653CEZ5_CALMS|nr:unnamed protein product [Callosobruchus maculatus]
MFAKQLVKVEIIIISQFLKYITCIHKISTVLVPTKTDKFHKYWQRCQLTVCLLHSQVLRSTLIPQLRTGEQRARATTATNQHEKMKLALGGGIRSVGTF